MKGAYYNENDPFAAEWLRVLIFFGHIAPGDVDERSIEDVQPDDLRGYAQHHFFAGIGVWSYALRQAGWPDDRPVWTGSCPCQPFSSAGKGGGFADERHLWPAWQWLVSQHRPDLLLGEQVASKDGRAWFDLVSSDLEDLDYACGAVDTCAAGVGAPHIRQRLYWVGHANKGGGGRYARAVPGAQGGLGRGLRGVADGVEPTGATSAERLADPVPAGRAEGWAGSGLGSPASSSSTGPVVDASGEQEGLSGRSREPGGAGSDMSDTDGGNTGAERQQRGRQHGQQQEDGGPGLLGQPDSPRKGPERGLSGGPDAQRQRGVGGLADDDERLDGRGPRAGEAGRGFAADNRLLGHHHHQGLAVGPFAAIEPGALRIEGAALGETGLVRGRWRGADWIFCRDGKYRPVEPGTFPLAHGAPARVGRLRGYGNAVNAGQAQVFVEAVMDTIDG